MGEGYGDMGSEAAQEPDYYRRILQAALEVVSAMSPAKAIKHPGVDDIGCLTPVNLNVQYRQT